MAFAHDAEVALEASAGLVNTRGEREGASKSDGHMCSSTRQRRTISKRSVQHWKPGGVKGFVGAALMMI